MSASHLTDDLRITGLREVSSPLQIHSEFPITETAAQTIFETRQAIHRILHGEDDRLLVIVGPCSIHDTKAALEYAALIKQARAKYEKDLLIVMRVYFEKPRTTVGWKGLINDPHLDGSFAINDGIRKARGLLLDINNMGVPAGTEFLDLISPQYVADLVSWGAIGARTTESQGHRELASGLSCPVGFKNSTNGSYGIAVDAINAASHPHHFMSLTKEGKSAIFSTSGNEDCHIILRGGDQGPNYDAASVAQATEKLIAAGINTGIMIDFSHANSSKQHHKQIEVGHDVAGQIASGNHNIKGLMIESHLNEGRQNAEHINDLAYGVSITDACINWKDTAPLLEVLANAAATRRGES
ncbi:MAG: 3-deoxy-7-phosphoheptulonate synthase [Zetaproteobacteria bacterium CG2_30_46_52]|nr:MAG: 3-deoxy-7-phosphoheptulonate synthase [Zetaproteobacteria bacterium CG2_30_46_52]